MIVQKERNVAYEIAVTQNRAHVEDPSFRLKFLRANMHDVGKPVRQMMSFLLHEAKYFGNDKVARDIALNDLNEEDKRLIFSGLYHIQKGSDRAGRTIVHSFGSILSRFKAETMVRLPTFSGVSCKASIVAHMYS